MELHAITIKHEDQRYPTVGDWRFPRIDILNVQVSRMENDDYIFLVMIHELVEAYLCQARGVSEESVSKFDIAYEDERPPDDYSEPGDSPEAPYNKEHVFATKIEKLIADELNVNWGYYEDAVNSL